MAAAPWIVSDELWGRIEPLLPKSSGGFAIRVVSGCLIGRRCRGSCLCCYTGIAWRHLPRELGSGGGSTCQRRWMSGSGLACGSSCTSCCLRSCVPPVSSSGRGRSRTQVTCRRKRGLRDGAEPG